MLYETVEKLGRKGLQFKSRLKVMIDAVLATGG